MGYSIYIGNAVLEEYDLDDTDGVYSPHYVVHGMTHPDAPEFPNDSMTGKSNSRHPSYTGWSEFVNQFGIRDLFGGNERSCFHAHPGCMRITENDLQIVRNRIAEWKLTHNKPPGFDPGLFPDEKEGEVGQFDYILARALWLEWWMDYALKNCERPAIYNH